MAEFFDSLPKAIVTGGVIGGVTTLIGLSAVNSSYSNAKAKVSALPVDDHVDVWHEAKHASKRQHVVFLLGPPFTNRAVIAKRLTINRHLLPAHGGPVVIEFDDCIPDDIKRQILTGKALKEEQVDIMIDNVIKKVQQTADERPVILSAVLPLRRWRRRVLLAFDERTVIRLTCDSNILIQRSAKTPPASPFVPERRNDVFDRNGLHDGHNEADYAHITPKQVYAASLLGFEALAMVSIDDGKTEKLRQTKHYQSARHLLRESYSSLHHERLASVNGNTSPETINNDEKSKPNKIDLNEKTNKKAQNTVQANIVVTPANDEQTTLENGAKMAKTNDVKNVSTNVRKQDKLELKESDARDNIEETVRWLNGLYEEIEMDHVKIDAGRTLHEVAKAVRLQVAHSMLRCAERSFNIERNTKAIESIQRVGGVQNIIGVCSMGIVVGVVAGAALFSWNNNN